MELTLEALVMKKVARRVLPFLWICYVACYLDRTNISFAAKSFETLGIDSAIFGRGAGIFFVGYFLFEVPSNLIMERVGARLWIARIMIMWGLISSCMMFVEGPSSLYSLRFILGAAEAGFFPGIVLYLTYWFPNAYRTRTLGLFITAPAVAEIVGGLLSGYLLDSPPRGLQGWQWLFLAEGIPSVVLGFVALFLLPNGPKNVAWLNPVEKAWLASQLESERAERERHHHMSLVQALGHPRVLRLCLLCFFINTPGYGLTLFLPQVIRGVLPQVSSRQLGYLSALPSVFAAVAMVLWARHSDRTGDRRWHTAIAVWVAAVGLGIFSLGVPPILGMACLVMGVVGRWSSIPPFFSMPTLFLSGTAAAGGIALINSIGALGGYVGPEIMGQLKKRTGGDLIGLLVMAGFLVAAGILAIALRFLKPAPLLAQSHSASTGTTNSRLSPYDRPDRGHSES